MTVRVTWPQMKGLLLKEAEEYFGFDCFLQMTLMFSVQAIVCLKVYFQVDYFQMEKSFLFLVVATEALFDLD